jgi:hypothetical protein
MVWENRGVLAAVSDRIFISGFVRILPSRKEIERSRVFGQHLDLIFIQDRSDEWPLNGAFFQRCKSELAGVAAHICQESFVNKIAKPARRIFKISCDFDRPGIFDQESKHWTLSCAQRLQHAIANDNVWASFWSNCLNHPLRTGVQVIPGGKENADAETYKDSYCPPESEFVIALLPVREREGKSYDEKYREEDQGQNRAHEIATVFLTLYAVFFGMVICFCLAVICDNRKS